ncbi:MAG: transposase [Candidatus Omnitrophica bacterium]|nr:transposase [Candidatus Omnitrophota bacterium]
MAYAVFPAQFANWQPCICFLQNLNDLFFREPFALHVRASFGRLAPQGSNYTWSHLTGRAQLWRTLKYDDIYIKGYQTIPDVHEGILEFFDDYNMARRHSSLGYKTPWSVFSGLELTGSAVAVPQEV